MNVPKQPENPFLKLMRRYRDDPVRFAREVIGIEPDEWQVELLDAVAAPAIRRISVRSGHGVGKSTGVAMAAIWHVLMRNVCNYSLSKATVIAPWVNYLRRLVALDGNASSTARLDGSKSNPKLALSSISLSRDTT